MTSSILTEKGPSRLIPLDPGWLNQGISYVCRRLLKMSRSRIRENSEFAGIQKSHDFCYRTFQIGYGIEQLSQLFILDCRSNWG